MSGKSECFAIGAALIVILAVCTKPAAWAQTSPDSWSLLESYVGGYPSGRGTGKTLAAQKVRKPIWNIVDFREAVITLIGNDRLRIVSTELNVESPVTQQGQWIQFSVCRPHDCDEDRADIFVNPHTKEIGVCWSEHTGTTAKNLWFFTGHIPRDVTNSHQRAGDAFPQGGCESDPVDEPFRLLAEYEGVAVAPPAPSGHSTNAAPPSRWYIYSYPTGQCQPSGSPAELLGSFRVTQQAAWTEGDVIDSNTGEIVETTVRTSANGLTTRKYSFFRSLARCSAFAKTQKQEIDKYR
jgi:hypothetical protein